MTVPIVAANAVIQRTVIYIPGSGFPHSLFAAANPVTADKDETTWVVIWEERKRVINGSLLPIETNEAMRLPNAVLMKNQATMFFITPFNFIKCIKFNLHAPDILAFKSDIDAVKSIYRQKNRSTI